MRLAASASAEQPVRARRQGVHVPAQMRPLGLGDERLLEDDLVYNHIHVGAAK